MTEQLFQNPISCPGVKFNPPLTPSQKKQHGTVPTKINTELRHFEEGYFVIPAAVAAGGRRLHYTKIGHRVTLTINYGGGFAIKSSAIDPPTQGSLGIVLPSRLRPTDDEATGTAIVKVAGQWYQSRCYVGVNGNVVVNPDNTGVGQWPVDQVNEIHSATMSYIVSDPDYN